MGIKLWLALLVASTLDAGVARYTHLKHFTRVDEYIYAGSKPTRSSDFAFLRSKGIKYILQADFLPGMKSHERELAARYGMEYFSVPMNASPLPPQEEHVNKALRIMRTRQPIYLHCALGRDRTGLLVGLYRIYFRGFSKEQAYRSMKKEGFRDAFFVGGLKIYFDKHIKIPSELVDLKVR